MKKFFLTILTVTVALPLFAFNFESGFIINEELKNEILNEVAASLQNQIKQKEKRAGKTDKKEHEFLTLIRESMDNTFQRISRNSALRPNVMTRAFIASQKEQKIAYEQMAYWDVPSQIFNYISRNFDLSKIKNVYVFCRYTNMTGIDVRFDYEGKKVNVIYTYNPDYQIGDNLPIAVNILQN